jgi:hypothetical protein
MQISFDKETLGIGFASWATRTNEEHITAESLKSLACLYVGGTPLPTIDFMQYLMQHKAHLKYNHRLKSMRYRQVWRRGGDSNPRYRFKPV